MGRAQVQGHGRKGAHSVRNEIDDLHSPGEHIDHGISPETGRPETGRHPRQGFHRYDAFPATGPCFPQTRKQGKLKAVNVSRIVLQAGRSRLHRNGLDQWYIYFLVLHGILMSSLPAGNILDWNEL